VTHPDIKFIRAVATLVGSVMGVGVFGLPYVFARAGFSAGLLALFVLSTLTLCVLFMYADVVAHTPGELRFAGILEKYLGRGWAKVGMVTAAFGLWGAMLAFMVAGGDLLGLLVGWDGATGRTALALALAAAVAAISSRGLAFVAGFETWMLGLLSFLFLFVAFAALPHADARNLAAAPAPGAWLALYGVTFFSLNGGMAAVPEMRALLGKRRARLPYAVFLGMTLVTALYALFTFAVVAATGARTSEFAVDALAPLIGGSFGTVGGTLAVLSVFSIFLVVSVELQSTFRFDARLPRMVAWALALAVPAALYLAGVRSFIGILGFIGAVFAGVNSVLVLMAYDKMRSSNVCREHACLEMPRAATVAIGALYVAGIVVTLISYANVL
jgi:amino acid permease